MYAIFQLLQIFVLAVFSISDKRILAQEDVKSSARDTLNTGNSYFFYQHSDYPKDCTEALNQCSSSISSGVHMIKPIGYTDPFEIYCKNENTSSGWTIIQRRIDRSITFNRNWTEYKVGFGFPSSEFWIGNEKLSYLTNQAVYELRIDLEFSNRTFFHVVYDTFRISDEWSQYAIVSVGTHHSYPDSAVTYCATNMVYGNCSCKPTCDDPENTRTCTTTCVEAQGCICEDGFLQKGDKCVSPNECGCYITEINKVITNGVSYVNSNCSLKYTCQADRLSMDFNYRCSSNAECREENGFRQCYCHDGYTGDGEICNIFKDCFDAYQAGYREDGVYTILPNGWPGSPFNVSCVMTTNGGGWTVFQRRTDGVTDFYRNWTSYRYGFGSFDGDFWLGNEQLHYLTNQKTYRLRIDITNSAGISKYDEYSSFRINNNDNKYRLESLGSRRGTGGNGMQYTHRRAFSTYDQDNDGCGSRNCAQGHRGAWWYASNWCTVCYASHCNNFPNGICSRGCTLSNLNGDYGGGRGENIFWDHNSNYCNLNFSEMKIRPA